MPAESAAIDAFIDRWRAATGSERANYQLFIGELCALLGLPAPEPAQADAGENAYCFERRVVFHHGDGAESHGFIDCYRRGAFVLEAKKLKPGGARSFDDALLRARSQAEGYARALPADEGRPPFLVVVDVGNVIELYAEFTRSGATYTPYPDPRSHRIALDDLRQEAIRERLRRLWLEPLALDPAQQSAKVTREIATHLAEVAKSLEAAGHAAESVAGFLTRCLFSMFAEDVQLIPKGSFSALLKECAANPAALPALLGGLWRDMDTGSPFSVAIRAALPRFNGKLFKNPGVLPLTKAQIALLQEAGTADWTQVEPAIFGTLLERALDPVERHALGAHYTPRAYVERLVLPTVVEPLRESWRYVQGAALVLAHEGKESAAIAEVRGFHHRLCSLRVLDPACGSGNFLYVALEHLKRLEGEVLNQLHDLGHGQAQLETEGFAVDPHQFLGLEINPRAAAVAELVLWIGYLQWHFRTRGTCLPPPPILRDFKNIECRDAVLAYDAMEHATDESGRVLSRWDGRTLTPHPVTGEPVPDETAQVPLERYLNPRPAQWPEADVVVGNPPFIGAGTMRAALGDGYVEALRGAWQDVSDSSDFVMFWWHHAAQLVREGRLSRFGFITTNSLRQTFNRRVLERHLAEGGEGVPPSLAAESAECVGRDSLAPLHLAFAVPDHPWVDSADGAAVRIAMTVAAPGPGEGRLLTVTGEREGGGEGMEVDLAERLGPIHPDLTIGANVAGARGLRANTDISQRGLEIGGAGFIVSAFDAAALGDPPIIRDYRNGKDLMDRPRGVKLIDAIGLSADELRRQYPAVYQWLLERVKPERDHNRMDSVRDRWWLHRRLREDLRAALAGLPRYIATVETAKHRVFQFLDAAIAPDNMLIAIALDCAYALGILSSSTHVAWALAQGGTLEDRPRYNKTRCLETFPFPAATQEQQARIRDLAEQLDAHRKRQQALHPGLTLTGMYNVLEKLRTGEPLSTKEKAIHEQGLVSVLQTLHDELDAAVLDAYGWHDQPNDETILERLVALNTERVKEEAAGQVRWLRPEFQCLETAREGVGSSRPTHSALSAAKEGGTTPPPSAPTAATAQERRPWPATLPEQVAAVARALAEAAGPIDLDALTTRFTGKGPWKKRLPQLLDTLVALGRARPVEGGRWLG